MSERPTAQELAEAILEFLGGEILPTLTDHRLRFRMLVAMNALGIVLLLGYWAALAFLPNPHDYSGNLSNKGNVTVVVDRALVGLYRVAQSGLAGGEA